MRTLQWTVRGAATRAQNGDSGSQATDGMEPNADHIVSPAEAGWFRLVGVRRRQKWTGLRNTAVSKLRIYTRLAAPSSPLNLKSTELAKMVSFAMDAWRLACH